jgi:hypothetical protein
MAADHQMSSMSTHRRKDLRGRDGGERRSMAFADYVKVALRGLLIRIALLFAGGALLYIAVWINFNAGHEILAGLWSPDSPTAIVVSVARLLAPALGLWLIYRGLR